MTKDSRPLTIKMPSLAEDRAITKAAKADPDVQPLTAKQLKSVAPFRSRLGPRNDA